MRRPVNQWISNLLRIVKTKQNGNHHVTERGRRVMSRFIFVAKAPNFGDRLTSCQKRLGTHASSVQSR
jgi:hypothetical protein